MRARAFHGSPILGRRPAATPVATPAATPVATPVDSAKAALDALTAEEACQAAYACKWRDAIGECAVDAALDAGRVFEEGDEAELDVERLIDFLADGDCGAAAELVRQAFPAARPLAAQQFINAARRRAP